MPDEPVDKPELHTPDEWLALRTPNTTIVSPNGWKGEGGRPYYDPITEEEFYERLKASTLRIRLN